MLRLVVDPIEPDLEALVKAAGALSRGGIVAFPTDTFYALAVDPQSDEAVQKLLAVKGREASVAVALIASDASQATHAGAFGAAEARLAGALWPGPLTIVVPAGARMSRVLSGDARTLGVRVPAHPVARGLAAAFGTCVTATSANLSGHPACTTADEVAAVFDRRIDLLLDGGPTPGGPASTIVQIVEGRPVLHRAGAISWDRVLESMQ